MNLKIEEFVKVFQIDTRAKLKPTSTVVNRSERCKSTNSWLNTEWFLRYR
jgi:hypothetical protein